MPEHLTINPWVVSPSGIAPESLDADAVRAVERLIERGHEAYFVGGCVRDILAGKQPKDFDIATAARPQQVKRTFPRNCRIIGRRFKLAHLHFFGGQKILEVSTFRRTPEAEGGEGDGEGDQEDDLLITHDNEFGSAEEDALRRDFTINALFLDPVRDRIIDYVEGMRDLQARVIRTIGEPVTRFREDPIRILRAAKFAARLGFDFDPPTFEAMRHVAPDLRRSAPPRVLEEILRLLRGGHAFESFQILRDVGALGVILPVIGRYLDSVPADERVVFWRTLEALDSRVLAGDVPGNPVLLGALFYRPVQVAAAAQPEASPTLVAEELLGDLTQTLRLPRRDTACVKRICGVQPRFRTLDSRRFRPEQFARDPFFPAAMVLFELSVEASGEDRTLVEEWRDRSRRGGASRSRADGDDAVDVEDVGAEVDEASLGDDDPLPDGPGADAGDGPRRKRRRRRRRGSRRGAEVSEDRTTDDDVAASDESPERDESETAGREARDPEARDTAARDTAAGDTAAGDTDDEEDRDFADDDVEARPRTTEASEESSSPDRDAAERDSDGGAAGEGGRRRRRRGGRRRRGRRDEASGSEPQTNAPAARTNEPAGERAPKPPREREPRQRESGGRGPKAREANDRGGREREPKARDPRAGDRGGRGGRGGQRGQGGQGGQGGRGNRRGRDRNDPREHRSEEIELVEPIPVDRSYLDQELDPKDVPTFGALLDGGHNPRRKRPPRLSVEDELGEPYKPPPHRKDDDGPPPPPPAPPADDEFGDW